MDQEPPKRPPTRFSRREAVKYGLGSLACATCGAWGIYCLVERFRLAGIAERLQCPSITYTYSEPILTTLKTLKRERLPMSTEILESTFALYKQLERQHSKGGFTSLLAAFGALLKTATDETIRRAFSTVSIKDVYNWIHTNLGDTLTSQRIATYKEFRGATKTAAMT
jgi:hypothetical protein